MNLRFIEIFNLLFYLSNSVIISSLIYFLNKINGNTWNSVKVFD